MHSNDLLGFAHTYGPNWSKNWSKTGQKRLTRERRQNDWGKHFLVLRLRLSRINLHEEQRNWSKLA